MVAVYMRWNTFASNYIKQIHTCGSEEERKPIVDKAIGENRGNTSVRNSFASGTGLLEIEPKSSHDSHW